MTRLVILIILFLLSVLAVLRAQAYYLWLMVIAVSEFPLVFAAGKWNYYFCYCEAAFAMRNINVMQLVYARPNNVSR